MAKWIEAMDYNSDETHVKKYYCSFCGKHVEVDWLPKKCPGCGATMINGVKTETIRIKYHTDEIDKVKKIAIGDWIDLRAAKQYELQAGDLAYIDLGVSIELPKGYEMIVAPRSSTPKQFGIICANSFGIIDNSFCGDNDIIKFAALAIRPTIIRVNDRICQFRIQENQPHINFDFVNTLGNPDRGGYGSTGRN